MQSRGGGDTGGVLWDFTRYQFDTPYLSLASQGDFMFSSTDCCLTQIVADDNHISTPKYGVRGDNALEYFPIWEFVPALNAQQRGKNCFPGILGYMLTHRNTDTESGRPKQSIFAVDQLHIEHCHLLVASPLVPIGYSAASLCAHDSRRADLVGSSKRT